MPSLTGTRDLMDACRHDWKSCTDTKYTSQRSDCSVGPVPTHSFAWNVADFASRAIAGLPRLSVWWMKLGFVPARIELGHPEKNGRHEGMHRTLAEEVADPPAANRRAQQRAMDRFRPGVQRRAAAPCAADVHSQLLL